jgi:hypothetical protein
VVRGVGVVADGEVLEPEVAVAGVDDAGAVVGLLERWQPAVVSVARTSSSGCLTRRSQALTLTRRAQAVDGVVSVDSQVTYDVDDTSDWAPHALLPTL